jgi:quercetin dioxygenase-like cupin family protein
MDRAMTVVAHRRPQTPPMASPFLEFDLTSEVDRLHGETTWNTGQTAKTLIKYDDLRVVLMALKAGAKIPAHKANGRISVQLLSGHIRLNASERAFDLLPGSLLALDRRVPHELEALEESVVFLTIAWPGGRHESIDDNDGPSQT